MIEIVRSILHALSDRVALWVAVASFIVGLPIYLVTLPASMTGGRIGLVNLQYLTGTTAAFAFIMTAALSVIVLLMTFLVREGQRARGGLATGGTLLGLITPLLCCSPVLPLTIGLIAIVFPTMGGTAGIAQAFIASHETAFLIFAVLLMALAIRQNAHKVLEGPRCRISRH